MKKFASMIMAAALIFALAVPAFAAEQKSTVKATIQAPKVALTIGALKVTANPYRLAIKPNSTATSTVSDQIIAPAVACVNKSDCAISYAIMVKPTDKNNVTFAPEATVTGTSASTTAPQAYIKVKSASIAADYEASGTSATAAPESWTYEIEVNGTLNAKSKSDATAADVYSKVAENSTTPVRVELARPAVAAATGAVSKGNSIWLTAEGKLNTGFDWTGKVDNAAIALEFDIIFDVTPVANPDPNASTEPTTQTEPTTEPTGGD